MSFKIGDKVEIIKKPYCSYSKNRDAVFSDIGIIDCPADSSNQVVFKNDRTGLYELINEECLSLIK